MNPTYRFLINGQKRPLMAKNQLFYPKVQHSFVGYQKKRIDPLNSEHKSLDESNQTVFSKMAKNDHLMAIFSLKINSFIPRYSIALLGIKQSVLIPRIQSTNVWTNLTYRFLKNGHKRPLMAVFAILLYFRVIRSIYSSNEAQSSSQWGYNTKQSLHDQSFSHNWPF